VPPLVTVSTASSPAALVQPILTTVRPVTSKVGRGELVNGRVTISLDTLALGVGRWPLTVIYDGDLNHASSQARVELRVTK